MNGFASFPLALAVLSLVSTCLALDKPRNQARARDLTEVDANVATLEQNLEFFKLDASDIDECPVCDDDNQETDRLIQQVLSKASRLIRRTSTFASFRRATRTCIGRRLYKKSMSSDSIVPILNATASHFAAFATRARRLAKALAASSPVEAQLVGVLEEMCHVSSDVA